MMDVPDAATGTRRVATRSNTVRWGIPHPRSEALELSTAGSFSRHANILCEPSAPGSVRWTGSLDDQTFAAVCARFV